MTEPTRNLAILFADVAGSTRIYETLGDTEALALIGRCLAVVKGACEGHGGRIVKTIGDEVMAAFPHADQAAEAAAEMQARIGLVDHSDPRVRIAIRVGFNFGPAIEVENDVFGDSVNVAARMVALAKAEQVILSAETRDSLALTLKQRVRQFDSLTVKGKHDDIGICELLWQDSEAELTAMSTRPRALPAHIRLRHGSTELELDEERPSCAIGRDPQNDLVIADRLASRMHARIERRRDKFVLVDQSSNGTYVTIEGEPEVHLRREELILRGKGRISFGHTHGDGLGERIEFFVSGQGPAAGPPGQQGRSTP
jgi:class 3 adenylate cyclase